MPAPIVSALPTSVSTHRLPRASHDVPKSKWEQAVDYSTSKKKKKNQANNMVPTVDEDIARVEYTTQENISLYYSIKQVMQNKVKAPSGEQSIIAEIKSLFDFGALIPVMAEDVPTSEKEKLIQSFMFLVDKTTAEGKFDRVKARLVAYRRKKNGKSIFMEETFSPTINSITVMTLLQLSANLTEYLLSAHDIKSAFLHTKTRKDMYMLVPKDVTDFIIQQYSYYRKFLTPQGLLYVKLGTYLYGLEESPREFNRLLHKVLLEFGFR